MPLVPAFGSPPVGLMLASPPLSLPAGPAPAPTPAAPPRPAGSTRVKSKSELPVRAPHAPAHQVRVMSPVKGPKTRAISAVYAKIRAPPVRSGRGAWLFELRGSPACRYRVLEPRYPEQNDGSHQR